MVRYLTISLALLMATVGLPLPPQSATVTGEVFGPDGVPVSGAQVWAAYSSPDHCYRAAPATATDDRGRFAFTLDVDDAAEPVFVVARKPGLGGDMQGVLPGQAALLQLVPPVTVHKGVVQNPSGQLTAAASVALPHYVSRGHPVALDLSEVLSHLFTTVTGADGTFELPDFSAYPSMELRVVAEGYAHQWRCRPPAAGGEAWTIVLQPESSFAGRIVREGRPVSGVAVFCRTQHGQGDRGRDEAATDARGRYELHHLSAGSFNVLVRPLPGLVAAALEGVTLAAGERVELPDLQLLPGGLIRGQVTQQDTGQPVAGLSIGACGPGNPMTSAGQTPTFTDDQGCFEIRAPAGPARLRIGSHAIGGRWYGQPKEDPRVAVVEGQVTEEVHLALRQSVDRWPGEARPARPEDLTMAVKLLDGYETVSAYEPVVALVELTNGSDETIAVRQSGELTIRMQVRDQTGRLVAITERPGMPLHFLSWADTLKPGQTKIRKMIMSALCPFKDAGEYTIRVQQLELSRCFPVLVEATAVVHVEPFDAARLQARCEQLFQTAARNSKILYSVRHDLVLPYLEKMANMWQPQYSCRAMRRIDTEAAGQLLDKLCARDDEVGRGARGSAKLPLRCTMWDIEGD